MVALLFPAILIILGVLIFNGSVDPNQKTNDDSNTPPHD
jgi:hypothetical protein